MKFIKSFICNYLCINNLNNCINYPRQYYGIKKIKKIYHENNIYYDIYQDNINVIPFNSINKKYIKYNSLTAEHIFPQSYTKNYKKAKFDMHNIFLTESLLNNNRSNYKFSDESLEDMENIYLLDYDYFLQYNRILKYNNVFDYNIINYKNNKKKIFIPNYYSRGLIARSIAYMDVTYENIDINNVIQKELLIKWNLEYPPTCIEKKQNEIIKNYQGNKNIFIDNYELIEFIYNN
jgi:endonuclease I